MNRSSIIALVILGLILAYFLSFGAEGTRKIQAGFYKVARRSSRLLRLRNRHGGEQRDPAAGGTGRDTLREGGDRALKATNQLADVENEEPAAGALAYRERSVFRLVPAEIITRAIPDMGRTATITRGKAEGTSPTSRS